MTADDGALDPTRSVAHSIYAEFLSKREGNPDFEFDTFVAGHPEQAAELRRIHENFNWLDNQRTSAIPDAIGQYRVLDTLGEGGMGTVYVAESRDKMRRKVAIKLIKLGMDTKQLLARFELEHHALTIMNHRNIARVFDAGATDDGRPYFVMEYVPGVPLTEYCDRERISTRERLQLFLPMCDAVQHAHQKGVIHRDLKPSNILVALEDGVPVPKIIDFGVAKAVSQPLTEQTLHTEIGQIIGTPAFMSPEQAEMTGIDIDTRTDVYSLGVILYWLLSGHLPFEPKQLRDAGYAETQRILREVDPPRPSARLTSSSTAADVATRHGTDTRTLTRSLRGDLDWVAMKALAKNRTRRYQSASELAADVQRYLEDEPVVARPPSRAYRLQKFVSRNKGLVTASVLIILALVGGLIGTFAGYREALIARDDASRQEQMASAALENVLQLSDVKLATDLAGEEGSLWPAVPDQVPALERWLENARALQARLPQHASVLQNLEARGVGESALPNHALTNAEIAWQRGVLTELVDRLEAFGGPDGAIARVEVRLEDAKSIERRSLDDHAEIWSETLATIKDRVAHPAYGGLELQPQLGLVPVGRDRKSGFFEFVHLPSGEVATRDADGKLQIKEETGIVFVLLPGGTVRIGSRPPHFDGEDAPHVDPLAHLNEAPIQQVQLQPFFISKFEMTQGQWVRLTGKNPSYYRPGRTFYGHMNDLRHPVEQVSWDECRTVMTRAGLELPTEAQWEYAARAGTTTPWHTGPTPQSLVGYANFADSFAHENGAPPYWPFEAWLDDGFTAHAPVGTYKANAFGLHEIHGNVWEWCRDQHETHGGPAARDGSGERVKAGGRARVFRGGSFFYGSGLARSSSRFPPAADYRSQSGGLRPARRVDR